MTTEEMSKCPVDHSKIKLENAKADSCPMHNKSTDINPDNNMPTTLNVQTSIPLPKERIISSIPRADSDESWVYPSPLMFYNALVRKGNQPDPFEMEKIVHIHNVVNEQCWVQILKWEKALYPEIKSERKLVRFMGKPSSPTIKSFINTYILGYEAPFDRHDWIVDRDGRKVRYIIDYYNGKSPSKDTPAVYMDVRPAPDHLRNLYDRIRMSFLTWKIQ